MGSTIGWHWLWRFFLVSVATLAVSAAVADEVVMMDGTHLNGSVIHKSGEKLTFKTVYAGEIQINWTDIRTLATDKPVDVLVVGDVEPQRAALVLSGEGGVRLYGRRIALVDIVYINPNPDQVGSAILYSGNAKASASYASGNTRSEQSYFDADFTARSAKYRYTLLGKIQSAREGPNENKTAGNWLGSGNFDRFLDDKNFLYVRASVERDRFKDIEYRSTVGIGYGFQFIETLRTNVSVRGGLDLVRVDHVQAQNERFPAFGWGVRATHKLMGTVELFHEHDGYQNLEDSNRTIIRARTGMRVPLFGSFNLSAQLNVDWDRRPQEDREPTDYVWLIGLGYSW